MLLNRPMPNVTINKMPNDARLNRVRIFILPSKKCKMCRIGPPSYGP